MRAEKMNINHVRRLRFELRMNQHELAKALNVSQQFISQVENGRCKLAPDKAAKLREIFLRRNNESH